MSFNHFKRFIATSARCCAKQKMKIAVQQPEDIGKLPIMDYVSSRKDRTRVFVWGNVKNGALGVKYVKQKNYIENIRCPKRLGFAERYDVTSAACGYGFTIFAVNTKDETKIYGTGLNTDSQLGRHESQQHNPLEVIFFPQPIFVPFRDSSHVRIIKVAAGRAHVAVLSSEGLHLFGNNSYGQCGRKIVQDEDYVNSQYVNHVEMLDEQEIVDVVCGQDHTIALTKGGQLFSCGWGADGQTGVGHFNSTDAFTKIEGDISNERIQKVSCRSDFAMAINDKGDVFGWGNTEYAQMITKDNEQQVCQPTHMKNCQKLGKVRDIAASGSSCLILTENGDVFVWGFGLLGTGPQVQHSKVPLLIPPQLFGRNDFSPDSQVLKIDCGLSHYTAVTNMGDLYSWGRNRDGCLGLGHLKDQYFPLKVAVGGYVKFVSCGTDHTVAICESFLADINKET